MAVGGENMKERAQLFGKSRSLVGVISYPPDDCIDPDKPALLLLNAGLVHHVGPNRLYVRLARHMAEQGFVVVRFDFSGLGDSPVRTDSMPYQQSTLQECMEVMDDLTADSGIERFCLMGISSGALVSLRVVLEDPRVVGAGILNPHGFADASKWVDHVENLSAGRIYAGNLLRLGSWRKALTGKTNYRRLGGAAWYALSHRFKKQETVSNVAGGVAPKLKEFLELKSRILLLFSGTDRSIDNFREILGSRWDQGLDSNIDKVVIPEANHTFSSPQHQTEVIQIIQRWMQKNWPDKDGVPVVSGAE
jgi:pimeloyl-ACP methyl ester carboxylesterase